MRISRRAALTGATAAVAGFDAELLEIGKTAALPGLDGPAEIALAASVDLADPAVPGHVND